MDWLDLLGAQGIEGSLENGQKSSQFTEMEIKVNRWAPWMLDTKKIKKKHFYTLNSLVKK